MANWFSGRKTYIVAALGGIVVIANFLGYLDSSTANLLLGILGFGGIAALRAAK